MWCVNSYLHGVFSKFVSARHGVTAKLPVLLQCDTKMLKKLQEMVGKDGMEEIYSKYKNPVAVLYKVVLTFATRDNTSKNTI